MDEENIEKPSINYKAFFIIGITFLPLGITTNNPGFTIVGAVFMVVGAYNKKKWNKEKKWSELSAKEKNMKIIFLIGLLTLLLVGFSILYLTK